MKKTISLVLVLALGLATKVANADFICGTPTNLGPTVNSSVGDWDSDISTDGLYLYFGSPRPGGSGSIDLWVATWARKDDEWGAPVNLGPTVNSPYQESDPSLSTDGLSLFFRSNRAGGSGNHDIWVAKRATTDDEWGEPVNLGTPVNSSYAEADPSIPADGLSLYFSDWTAPRPGGQGDFDIWVTERQTTDDEWGTPVNLGPPINTSYRDWSPNISKDGLLLLFTSNRPGGSGGNDTWVTRRATRDDLWGPPANLGPIVNSAIQEWDPSLSADGSTLYFNRGMVGGAMTYIRHQLFPSSTSTMMGLSMLPTCVLWLTTGARTTPCVILGRCLGVMASSMFRT